MTTFWFIFLITVVFESNCVSPPRSAGVAPPADCNGNNENQKFYQEACTNDTDCFGGPQSMVCKNDTCQCADDFLPEERFTGEKSVQTVCVPAPSLFTKCNTTCQKPAVCLPYTGEGGDGKIKVCQCAQPFRFENGLCYLNCTADEFYDSSKYKCIKKCKPNEVRINETCVALVDLNATCQSDSQCQTPFSECKTNSCLCKAGFKAVKSVCTPETVACPFGRPLTKDKSFVPCHTIAAKDDDDDDDSSDEHHNQTGKISPVPVDGGKRKSDCPEGNFCMITDGGYNPSPNSTGFCCPIHPIACPVGSPHPTAKCGSVLRAEESCPYESHFCSSFQSPSLGDTALCCPKTCPSNSVEIGNKCLPKVRLGDSCSNKEQCTDSYTDCIGGVCECRAGATQTDEPSYRYCSIKCEDDEVLQGDKCQKRIKLADVCTEKKGYLCPEYATCSPTRKQCVCQCGAFTLVDNVCAPPPICRPPRVIPIMELSDRAGKAGAPPPIPRISDEEREKLLKNTTFCKVKGKTPPTGVKVADKCAQNQYCSEYITKLGICCPKPEPFCPFGGKPKKDSVCDPKNPLSCGLDNTCVKYLHAVDQDLNSKDYTVCCSKSILTPEPEDGGAE